MDALLQTIATDIVANVLTSFIAQVGKLSKTAATRKTSGRDIRNAITDRGAMGHIAPLFPSNLGVELQQALKDYFASPEAQEIVSQIFALIITESANSERNLTQRQSLRRELLTSIQRHASVRHAGVVSEIDAIGDELFDRLFALIDGSIEIAKRTGLLPVRELQSGFSQRWLADKISNIDRNLALLNATEVLDLAEINEFADKYRHQMATRHGYITPPSFDGATKMAIDQLYVLPQLLRWTAKPRERRQYTNPDYAEFVTGLTRSVILGTPGGGKSTLAQKICHDLAIGSFQGQQVVPILIQLRDYGSEKLTKSCSIIQFIEMRASSNYQTQPPRGAIGYLITCGRAVVIFDGLDELLDSHRRQEIASDIESFCTLYPAVPVVVTSREVGYSQAPLSGDMFQVFRIGPFDRKRVAEYATKWFRANSDASDVECQATVRAFLNESMTVADLRTNPLLLALLCNIYKGENYLPANRAEIYEKCAVMLYERWDKSRGIQVTLSHAAHLPAILRHIANWIYSQPALQTGVTEYRLVHEIVEYLSPAYVSDRAMAEAIAREFVEFFTGRAWILAETGTSGRGERLYQFIHRTFLEYFTACYLVRRHSNAASLLNVLAPKIAAQEWDVVAQLTFQMLDRQVDSAGDDLLNRLLDFAQEKSERTRWNILLFAARSLQFMLPTRAVVCRLVRTSLTQMFVQPRQTGELWLISPWFIEDTDVEATDVIDLSFDDIPELEAYEPFYDTHPEPLSLDEACRALFATFLVTSSENSEAVATETVSVLRGVIGSLDELMVSAALVISVQLPLLPTSTISTNRLHDIWTKFADSIFLDYAHLLPRQYLLETRLALEGWLRGFVSLPEVARWHSIGTVFGSLLSSEQYGIVPAVDEFRTALAAVSTSGSQKDVAHLLSFGDLSEYMLSAPTPWNGPFGASSKLFFELARDLETTWNTVNALIPFTGSLLFTAATIVAWTIDCARMSGPANVVDETVAAGVVTHHLDKLPQLGEVLSAYLGRIAPGELTSNLERWGMSHEQIDFLCQWSSHKIKLVDTGDIPF